MIFIVRSKTRQRFAVGLKLLLFLVILAFILSQVMSVFHKSSLSGGGWLKDDRPTGNPMRVESKEAPKNNVEKDNLLDRFLNSLQGFYRD